PNPTTLLVLVQAAGEPPDPELVRRTTAVAVEPLPPARVERWMAHRARQLALTLAPEAGALLLDAVGSDLAALARELEKLAALAGGGSRPATREDVAALVGVRRAKRSRTWWTRRSSGGRRTPRSWSRRFSSRR